MSSLEVARGDIEFVVNNGAARLGIEQLRREFQQTTGAMSTEALRAAAAQEKLDRAIARHGPQSLAAKNATLAYRREMQSLGATSEATALKLGSEERALGRFVRGAAVGTGVMSGFGRAASFASTAFLGGTGLVFAIRAATKAAIEQQATQGQLAAAVRAAGIEYEQQRSHVQAAIREQELLGFTEEDSAKAFTLAVTATKNVADAQRILSVSANIARGKNTDLETSTRLLVKAYLGQSRALKALGIDVQKGVKGFEVLDQAQRAYAGRAVAYIHSAAGAQALLTVEIRQTEAAIGQALLPTVTRLSDRLAHWLDNDRNLHRVQRDVNRAVKDGTAIVHGFVDAEKLIAPPIQKVVGALGGLENAVQLALIAGIVLKARRAAISFGLIQAASTRTATVIAADSAAEVAALGRVAAAEAGVAAAGLGGGGRRGGGGGTAFFPLLFRRGGGALRFGGDLALFYGALKAFEGFAGPAPKSDQSLGQALQHPFKELQELGYYLRHPFGSAQDQRHHTGGPYLGEDWMYDPTWYPGKTPAAGGGRRFYPGGAPPAAGPVPTGFGTLPLETQLAIRAANAGLTGTSADDLAVAQQQRALYSRRVSTLQTRLAGAKGKRAETIATQLQTALANEQQAQSQIDQIQADANAAKVAAANKAAAAAKKKANEARKAQQEISDSATALIQQLGREAGPLGVNVSRLQAAEKKALRARVEAAKRAIDLRNQNLQNELALAQLAETQAGTNTAALARAHKAELAAEYAILREEQRQGRGLTGLAKAENIAEQIATRQAIAQLRAQQQTTALDRGQNERQFLAAFQQIVGAYAPNAFPVDVGAAVKQSATHQYEMKHELRRQTRALVGLGQDAFPASRYANSSASAAFG